MERETQEILQDLNQILNEAGLAVAKHVQSLTAHNPGQPSTEYVELQRALAQVLDKISDARLALLDFDRVVQGPED